MDDTPGDHIGRGLAYLKRVQRTDGGFDSFSSKREQPFAASYTYNATFAPALILDALADVPGSERLRNPLAGWLLAQKSASWAFNYWAADAAERQTMPYPDDLDDTFCALIGLYRHDRTLIDAEALGRIVRLLLAAENKVGGPYRTWLVPPGADAVWQDVDLAVNSNIAYFLQLVAQPLPNLTACMDAAITAERYTSPYYPSPVPLWHYLARAYHGRQTAQLKRHILQAGHSGTWGSPLHTALAIRALRQLGEPAPASALHYLHRTQQPDGSWPAETYCLDPARDGTQYYSGAASLTTAFVLAALSVPPTASRRAPPPDHEALDLHGTITRDAGAAFQALPGSTLRSYARATLRRMVRGDHNREIALLPLFVARSLQNVPRPPQKLLCSLGLANLYGWAAYTIYDDFLDASGDIRLLPVANVALRKSHQQFLNAVPGGRAYRTFVHDIFNRIDAANAWEATHCRFVVHGKQISLGHLPRYGGGAQLAERSLGHALPAIAILAHADISPDDERAQALLAALKHYLIARQLGDDLLDWQADLYAGTCTFVVAALLRGAGVAPGTYPLAKLVPRLHREFTRSTLPATSKAIRRHTAAARRLLASSTVIATGTPIAKLVDHLEQLAAQQIQTQKDTQAFLRSYNSGIAKKHTIATDLQK
jgi:plasmid stability protein